MLRCTLFDRALIYGGLWQGSRLAGPFYDFPADSGSVLYFSLAVTDFVLAVGDLLLALIHFHVCGGFAGWLPLQ
ncbi:MAG: hypothetical protein ACPHCV_08110 [Pseudohongiellaceae bacterium]